MVMNEETNNPTETMMDGVSHQRLLQVSLRLAAKRQNFTEDIDLWIERRADDRDYAHAQTSHSGEKLCNSLESKYEVGSRVQNRARRRR